MRILGAMIEIAGDSTRDGCWALVRLRLDGDRIVDADADGLDADVRGLSLLEAAAVGGETLAVDALANAIGPVFRAAPSADRVAVAMSGGVDSAVALLRAGPEAIGVTLRLWVDPEGSETDKACCSPAAVIAARETCHALGLPHVTLDLREEFRRAVVEPFVRGLRARRDAEPVHAVQRRLSLRRAARVRPSRRRCAARHGALRADPRAPRPPLARPRRRRAEGPVVHARPPRPGEARPDLVPARGPDEGPRRARRLPRPGSPPPSARRARRRASSPGTTTGSSSSGAASR